MKMVKSLILGSAAGFVAMSGAQAADLPVKAKAVEYVKICSLYGAGFYYIPGTDTCIKLGGYVRVDIAANANAVFTSNYSTTTNQPGGLGDRFTNAYTWRSREDLNIDTRTATEYGVVRTFFDATFTWTDDNYTASTNAGLGSAYSQIGQQGGTTTSALVNAGNATSGGVATGALGVYYAFIQFAGFTIGKAVSPFSASWTNYPGNNYDALVGGGGTVTGVNQFVYTAQFGSGVSGTIGFQDPTQYYQAGILNFGPGVVPTSGLVGSSSQLGVATNGLGVSDYAGTVFPDIVGNIAISQAWGSAQLSAAAHDNNPAYYCNGTGGLGSQTASLSASTGVAASSGACGSSNTSAGVATNQNVQGGHPNDAWGYAVQGALSLNVPQTGAGDVLNVSGVYTRGATRYNIQDLASSAGSWTTFAGINNGGGILGKVGIGVAPDAVFGNGGQLQLISTWGGRGAFTHNWTPTWNTSVYGAYAYVNYGSTSNPTSAASVFCQSFVSGNYSATIAGQGIVSCNPNYSVTQLGTVTRWTPVKNLTFSGEFVYSYLKQNNTGNITTSGSYGTGLYTLANQTTYQVLLRAQRNW